MFRLLRITILLVLLIMVAGSTWLTRARSTDWQEPLWVYVYPQAADASSRTRAYVDTVRDRDFAAVERFMQREVSRYGHALKQPVKISVVTPPDDLPPRLPTGRNVLKVAWWSLRMRAWSWWVEKGQPRPRPDIQIFVQYFNPEGKDMLEASVGMQKGQVGIVNAYAGRRMAARNRLVLTHELLHTLGATDKYLAGVGRPVAPEGLADSNRVPRYPQVQAEIMAMAVALSENRHRAATSLREATIGEFTASEIGLR